jgi:hypothetical protein
MSTFANPVELKISRNDLIIILTDYMNREIFRDAHQVEHLQLHPNGDHCITMDVHPSDVKMPSPAKPAKDQESDDAQD